MPRLVAFGCSYTFGEGLPDTYPIPELHKDRVPSLQAWPAHLGKKLNLESINYGWGGSGNAEILLRLLKTKIYSDDIVVIQWSHFTRLDFYQIVNKYGDGQRVYESGATYNKHKLLVAKMKLEDKFWIENM
ncbi:hypothetical protein EBU71_22405, partial [bacterium]|nr:hypothetical protein [Candidatus Elulimicrobium humile]